MKPLYFILFVIFGISCSSQENPFTTATATSPSPCSSLYPFEKSIIHLDSLVKSNTTNAESNFKKCSKYKNRFLNQRFWFKMPQDSIVKDDWCTYEFVSDFNIKITNPDYEITYLSMPIRWKKGEGFQQPYVIVRDKEIILIYDRSEDDFYRFYRIDWKTEILDSLHLPRDGYDNNRVRKNKGVGRSDNFSFNELVLPFEFSKNFYVFSTNSFRDRGKTTIVDLEKFTYHTYDFGISGVVWDGDETNLIGLLGLPVKTDQQYESEINFYSLVDSNTVTLNLGYANEASSTLKIGDSLIIANYHPIATGSSLYAFNMKTGKQIWKADVLQLMIDHSKYFNSVVISRYENKIIMEGNEAGGNYLQIFDVKTGKRLKQFGVSE